MEGVGDVAAGAGCSDTASEFNVVSSVEGWLYREGSEFVVENEE